MCSLFLAGIIGICIFNSPINHGFPFQILPGGLPVEIKLNSTITFTSDPQLTLIDYDGIIDDVIEGQLVVAQPFNACSQIQLPPTSIFDTDASQSLELNELVRKPTFWILLANNLNCDLATKISHALSAKYSAVLVGNMDESSIETDSDFYFGSGSAPVYIETVGEKNMKLIEDEHENEARIQLSQLEIVFADLFSYSIITFIGIATGLVVLVMLIWIFQRLSGHRLINYWNKQHRSHRVLKALNNTKVESWKPDVPFLNNESCIICLEDFIIEDRVRVLQCFHGFHISCVDPWILKVNPSCPTCKQKLIEDLPDDFQFIYSDGNMNETAPLLPVPALIF